MGWFFYSGLLCPVCVLSAKPSGFPYPGKRFIVWLGAPGVFHFVM